MTIKTAIKMVTPAQAQAWLDDPRAINPRGRTNKSRITSYANQILNDEWEMNGATISFDSDGVLRDGFHRLRGVVQANKSAKFLVVTGVQPKAVKVIDSGLPRSMADVLASSMEVSGYAAQMAATSKSVIAWERDIIHSNSAISTGVSRSEVVNFALENTDALLNAIQMGGIVRDAIGGSLTAWSAFFFRVAGEGYDQELVKQFFTGITTGANLKVGDPRLALRNWFVTAQAQRRRNSPGITAQLAVQIIVRAWNHYVRNEERISIRQSQVKGALVPQPMTTEGYVAPVAPARRRVVTAGNKKKPTKKAAVKKTAARKVSA